MVGRENYRGKKPPVVVGGTPRGRGGFHGSGKTKSDKDRDVWIPRTRGEKTGEGPTKWTWDAR